jgi:uncharacterized repeat protein (TIGR03803 family)
VSAAVFFLANLGAPAAQGQTYHEKVLHSFAGGPDGTYPYAGLVGDSAGNLYGTTLYGGAYGAGTVFKVTAAGVESMLYSFTGGADGKEPQAGLVRDPAGNLYGTAVYGGLSGCLGHGCGVVFKVIASGGESVLYSFCSKDGCSDGANPDAGLIRDSVGKL